nr:CehA/McbA family metallohydrolase [Candidatus Sigynarchaeota archaeon]
MDPILAEIFRFGIWFVAIIGLAFLSYVIYSLAEGQGGKLPIPDKALDYSYKPNFLPENGYFIDLHGHTLASDGWLTPEQLIKWHMANGFNAFVLTDHNTGKNNKAILAMQDKYPNILIIPGYEWTADRVHLNFIGIEDFPDKPSPNPSDDEIKSAITKAKSMGAIVLVDHVTWTLDQPRLRSGELVHPVREALLDWGADGFEINNEMRWYDPKTMHLHESYWKGEWKGRKIFLGSGTDIHNPFKQWASCWTELLLTREERKHVTFEVVKRALLDGRSKPWTDHDFRVPHEARFHPGASRAWVKTGLAPFVGVVEGARLVATSKRKIASYV